jgi:hypothetical protein
MQVFLSTEVAQYVSNVWQNIGINAQDVCYKEKYFYFVLFRKVDFSIQVFLSTEDAQNVSNTFVFGKLLA